MRLRCEEEKRQSRWFNCGEMARHGLWETSLIEAAAAARLRPAFPWQPLGQRSGTSFDALEQRRACSRLWTLGGGASVWRGGRRQQRHT